MQLAVTTPHLIKRLRRMPWARPMKLMQAPLIAAIQLPEGVRQDKLTLIGLRTSDASRWVHVTYYNLHNAEPFTLREGNQRKSTNQVVGRGYGSILEAYRQHPEVKFLGPNGQPCTRDTRGVLQRMSIERGTKYPIRKESNRRWAEGDDASLLRQPVELEPRAFHAQLVQIRIGVTLT